MVPILESIKKKLTLQWRFQSLETIDVGLQARHRNIAALLSWDNHPLVFSHVSEIVAGHRPVQRDLDTVGTLKTDPFSSQLYSIGLRNPWCVSVTVWNRKNNKSYIYIKNFLADISCNIFAPKSQSFLNFSKLLCSKIGKNPWFDKKRKNPATFLN